MAIVKKRSWINVILVTWGSVNVILAVNLCVSFGNQVSFNN